MTPEKLEKIRRLAEDIRGDPATRAIALAALKRYSQPQPEPVHVGAAFSDLHNRPGVPRSAEWERQTFMNLYQWKRSKSGNFHHSVSHKGRGYHIVLFPHKKTPTFGWLRDSDGLETVWSGRFRTIGEAHANAWASLMAI